jgi:hypothetical protein
MTVSKQIATYLVAASCSLFALQLGERLLSPGIQGFVSTAEARVGRPLTPVSVAGVARRTTRRCAAGVYNC